MRIAGWVVAVVVLASGPCFAEAGDRDGKELYAAYCAACHGAQARGDGVDADLFSPRPPNLRSGVLRKHSDDALVEWVRHGRRLTLGKDAVRMKTQSDDTETLVAHLHRLPNLRWRQIERGQEIYVDRCEVCHGPFGHASTILPRGVTKLPRDLSDPAYQAATSDATLLARARHGRGAMPAVGNLDIKENADALVAYLRLLTPGYETYSRFCAGCHGDDGRGPGVDWATERRPIVVFDAAYFSGKDPEQLRRQVWHMLDDTSPQMPHMNRVLRPRDVRAILAYLRTLRPE